MQIPFIGINITNILELTKDASLPISYYLFYFLLLKLTNSIKSRKREYGDRLDSFEHCNS
jgi:hypothetical protein